MSLLDFLLVVAVGLVAGFINTLAGGGSLLTLPLLIFMGLPSAVANGTNRIAILLQNISAVAGFKSKGVSVFPYSIWLGLSAIVGAVIGAKFSVEISDVWFKRILAIIMISVAVLIVLNPFKSTEDLQERLGSKSQLLGVFVFFFIGIYGGFIQAGVGFLIIAALTFVNRFSLVKTNSVKVFVILLYTIASLGVFIYEDKVAWLWGLTLAFGNMTGAWFASRWSVDKGDKWVKRVLLVTVIILAIRLLVITEI